MKSTPKIKQIQPRNLLINGAFDFWQRATSGILGTSFSYFGPDRIGGWGSGSGTRHDFARDTDVPDSTFKYSLKVTGKATATTFRVDQRVESDNTRSLLNKTVTASAWVKHNLVGNQNFNITITTPNTEHNWFVSDTVSSVGTISVPSGQWTKISYTWNISDESLAPDNGLYLRVAPSFALDDSGKSVWTTGWTLNEGDAAPTFFQRAGQNISEELAMCQRYYSKSYLLESPPGTSEDEGMYAGVGYSTAAMGGTFQFPSAMRTIPSIAIYSRLGASGKVTSYLSTADIGSSFASTAETNRSFPEVRLGSGLTVGVVYRCHWTADAEL